MKQKIAIIIPSFKRPTALYNSLNSIAQSKLSHNFSLNIIVVITGNDLDSHLVVSRFKNLPSRRMNFSVVTGDSNWLWGRSIFEGARSIASNPSCYSAIILMNDDIYFDEFFLNKILTDFYNIYKCEYILTAPIKNYENTIINSGIFKVRPFRIQSLQIMDTLIENKGDAVGTRFAIFPNSVFRVLNRRFFLFFPHYLGDIYISNSLLSNVISLNNISFRTQDELSKSVMGQSRFTSYFNIKGHTRLLSYFWFWIFYFFPKQ